MRNQMILGAALLIGACGSTASAAQFTWNWTAGSTPGLNNAGGTFKSIHSEYNSVTGAFVWNATFSDRVTRGYTLAISNGPNPKGHAGQLALIYFDAGPNASFANPNVQIFGYNGQNSLNSCRDGNAAVPGNQTPDFITNSGLEGAGLQASVQDVGATDRVFSLSMNVGGVNGHTALYPGPLGQSEWEGIAFAERIGLWFHPNRNPNTTYDAAGRLTNYGGGGQGWFDGSGLVTQAVPLPTGAAMGFIGLAGVGLIARRRMNRR